MSEKTAQEEVDSVLSKIQRIIAGGGNYIFRGEAKKYKQISSTLYRAYRKVLSKEEAAEGMLYPFTMDEIQRQATSDAGQYIKAEDDDAVLERIQHYGGDTNLIDFSSDYLIALFFACDGEPRKHGRLIVYDTNASNNATVRLIQPRGRRGRVDAQKSIFVYPPSGVLDAKQVKSIAISATLKQPILDFLRTHHDITPSTVYPDIHGYISRHTIHKEVYTHLYRGYYYDNEGRRQAALTVRYTREQDTEKAQIHADNTRIAYENAIAEYTTAIELAPQFANAYYNRGVAYGELREYQHAIADYTMALELTPRFANAHYGRGVAYKELHEYRRAIADYTRAIELAPQFAGAYHNRGVAYGRLGEHENAIEDYTRAIEIAPQCAESYFERGLANYELEKYLQAIEDYSKAIECAPQFAIAYSNRGLSYEELHEYEKAIEDYDKAIEIAPQFAIAYNNRGVAYRELHEYEKALADYVKAIELAPQYAAAYSNRGVVYGKLGEYNKAIADYDKAIELAPHMTNAYRNRGVVYGRLGEHDKALADYTRAIELAPQFAGAYRNRGIVYGRLGEHEKALADFDKVIEIAPQFAGAYRDRARCYRELALGEPHEEKRHGYYKCALEDRYAIVRNNPHNLADYRALFSTYHDFCNRARSDAETQRVRDIGMPVMRRALELAEAQGDDELYERVEGAFGGLST